MTRKEIAEGMKETAVKISHILANLIRWAEIEFVEFSSEEVFKFSGYYPGRRTRLYFVKKIESKNKKD